jgi:hypothetical protein
VTPIKTPHLLSKQQEQTVIFPPSESEILSTPPKEKLWRGVQKELSQNIFTTVFFGIPAF